MHREGSSGSVTDINRLGYEKRVNRVVDHIHEHLADDLSLAALARVAAFSPFHFHRVGPREFVVQAKSSAVNFLRISVDRSTTCSPDGVLAKDSPEVGPDAEDKDHRSSQRLG